MLLFLLFLFTFIPLLLQSVLPQTRRKKKKAKTKKGHKLIFSMLGTRQVLYFNHFKISSYNRFISSYNKCRKEMPAPKRSAQQPISEHKKPRSEACNMLDCLGNSALKRKAGSLTMHVLMFYKNVNSLTYLQLYFLLEKAKHVMHSDTFCVFLNVKIILLCQQRSG